MTTVATRPETTKTTIRERNVCSHCDWVVANQEKVEGGAKQTRHPKYHIIM